MVRRAGASALALVQGVGDADVIPTNGVWMITQGRAGAGAGARRRTRRRNTLGFWQGHSP